MRLIIVIVICVIWGVIVQNYAAPVDPSMTEYTFGYGILHGTSWFILLVLKWVGTPLYIFAAFHTWGYVAGFIIGVAISIILFIVALIFSLAG